MAAGPDRPNIPDARPDVSAPVGARDRIQSIDVLRGFALLGILMPNIISFAMPVGAMTDPQVMTQTVGILSEQVGTRIAPHTTWNQLGYDITAVGFTGKFMFQFAMLFGAGVIMYDRKFAATSKLSKGFALWARRNAWLLAIGLVHAFGFWFGDILVWYASVGLIALWWLRRLSPTTMLVVAGASYLVGVTLMTGFSLFGLWAVSRGDIPASDLNGGEPIVQITAFTGTYLAAFLNRATTLVFFYIVFPFTFFWSVLGLMLTGAALTKTGVLTGQRSVTFYAWMSALGLGIGLPLTLGVFVGLRATGMDHPGFLWQSIAQLVGIPQALGYTGLVLLVHKLGWLKPLTTALAAVGRMALTNYLSHTLICTTIFYGYALGYFGQVQYPELFALAGLIWLFNIALSLIWLRSFRFGPAEWLWRSLTYWKLQPLRHPPAPAQP